MSRFKLPQLTSRVWKVWRRNLDVFLKTWHVNFLPSLLEPILYLVAFGFGLGVLISGPVEGGSYLEFIGAGLVAISVMYGAFFECTYASFVRMYFQKTFDAIVATPVSVEEVIAGELLWGATRAAINASIVLVVVAAFSLVSSLWVLLVPLVAFFGGLLFAALAMCFTAVAPDIDFFNFPTFLFITPMFLLSGTFFPLSLVPAPLQAVAVGVLPLTHIVNLTRTLILGRAEPILGASPQLMLGLNVLWIGVATAVFFLLAIILMKRRLIK